jgi:hypothetical protein
MRQLRIFTDKETNYLIKKYKNTPAIKIAKKLGRSIDSIYNKAKYLGLKSNISGYGRPKYTHDTLFFVIPTKENCYWAGFIAADGNIKKDTHNLTISLQRRDKKHLKKFAKSINYNGPIIDSIVRKWNKIYPISTLKINSFSDSSYNLETTFNVVPKKSLTLVPPNLTDPKLVKAFITGYIDGDGCIFKDDVRDNYQYLRLCILGTKELLNWIKTFFDEHYNIRGTCIFKKNKIYYYNVNGKNAAIVLKDLNKIKVPKLDRKWSKVDLCDNRGRFHV